MADLSLALFFNTYKHSHIFRVYRLERYSRSQRRYDKAVNVP